MHQWTLDKSRSLSEILEKNGALDPAIAWYSKTWSSGTSPTTAATRKKACRRLLSAPTLAVDARVARRSRRRGEPEQAGQRATRRRRTAWTQTRPARGPAQLDEHDGRYRIIHLHNKGGLGTIFKAEDREVKREVALKQMKEEIASDQATAASGSFSRPKSRATSSIPVSCRCTASAILRWPAVLRDAVHRRQGAQGGGRQFHKNPCSSPMPVPASVSFRISCAAFWRSARRWPMRTAGA